MAEHPEKAKHQIKRLYIHSMIGNFMNTIVVVYYAIHNHFIYSMLSITCYRHYILAQ